MTLNELVEEYLRVHQAAPSTLEKLRWLFSKATAEFGTVALAELRADAICAWRGALPEGHRFEATKALRQVLNAAVAWELIDANPARRGVPNPLRRRLAGRVGRGDRGPLPGRQARSESRRGSTA